MRPGVFGIVRWEGGWDRIGDQQHWMVFMEDARFDPVPLSKYAKSKANGILSDANKGLLQKEKYYSIIESNPRFLTLLWNLAPKTTIFS